eukprot:TRINITY_DN57911_c0_g1_i2.p1 TRINITY_DN57911_c0_g1~~TRINITY_DN57911_c0_g1_i2.p1  ORF type:complete len:200 (+),score=23.44 TRINITY_DN57911_c0_g1_i2:45-602(+)
MRVRVQRAFTPGPYKDYLIVDAHDEVDLPFVDDPQGLEEEWVWAQKVEGVHSSSANVSASCGWLPTWVIRPGEEHCHVLGQLTKIALSQGTKLAVGSRGIEQNNGTTLIPIRSLGQMWMVVDSSVAKHFMEGTPLIAAEQSLSCDVTSDNLQRKRGDISECEDDKWGFLRGVLLLSPRTDGAVGA